MRPLLLRTFALTLLTAGCTTSTPEHEAAAPWALHFEVLDNHQDGPNSFKAALTLINKGTAAVDRSGWSLYFNFARMIVPESLPPSVAITHVNGDFFKLEPTEAFAPLQAGDSLRIVFDAQFWVIKEAEAPAGFYVVFTDAEGRAAPPQVVQDVTLAPFRDRQQTDRMMGDNLLVPTPASRYAQNLSLTASPPDQVDRIIPTPVSLRPGNGSTTLDGATEIRYAAGLETEAAFLADALEPLLGMRPTTVESADPAASAIVLKTDEAIEDNEAYRLTIDAAQGVAIAGADAAGVFYGIQSLRAWMPVEAYRQAQEAITLDAVTVEDAPRFAYRGQHLDVARNFQSKETVEKLLDAMAFYKLNRFHFHLTDDEGWRLAIDGLPELTEVGAQRGHTLDERDHLVPSFGSGPDPDDSHGSGFYSRAAFIDLLRYARDRHIEVIPEIDVPGHARAAIKAMEARHARLTAQGQDEEAAAFLLTDPNDQSEYQSVQGWNDNVVDVCLPSTYHFLKTVIDDVVAMYAEAGARLTTIHTGGDEVPHGVWQQSPACRRLIDENADVDGHDDLPGYFLREIGSLLAERGLVTAGWEEIGLKEEGSAKIPNADFLDSNFQPYAWNSVWGWGAEDVGYKLANAGYEVVLCNVTNLYFDLAYDKDPQEPGYYWGGFVDTRKPYELAPLDLYKSAWHDMMGNALDPDIFQHHERLTEAGKQNILGIQGELWAENAKSAEIIEYLAFPKLLGLAERAWAAQPGWAQIDNPTERRHQLDVAWSRFAHTLGHRDLPRLDYLFGGIAYRLPPPGGVIENGTLKANVAFPGLSIRYTTDGTKPTASSTLYEGPVAVSGTVNLKTFDSRGRGSRAVVVEG